MAGRLAAVESLTRAPLTTLQPEDIVLEGVPAAWRGLDADAHFFRVRCTRRLYAWRLRQTYLSRKLQCPACKHEFVADWGEVDDPADGQPAQPPLT